MGETTIDVSNAKLSDLSDTANACYGDYENKMVAKESADQKVADAQAALDKATSDLYYCDPGAPIPEDKLDAAKEAKEAVESAKEGAAQAEGDLEKAAEDAQAAADQLEAKKKEMEAARPTDMSYVVYTAQTSCKFGMRPSVIVLPETHGIFVRGIPQMTVKDTIPELNIINFGGCNSVENPSTIAAAKAASEAAKIKAKEDRTFGEKIIDKFMGDGGDEVDDSLIGQCYGECTPMLCVGTSWSKEKEKVSLNGEAPLQRRGELVCNFGGTIILETNGQPE